MKKTNLIVVGGLTAALGLTACTAGQTGPPTQTVTNPTAPGVSSLELAVGTANIAGSPTLGLNVVALYRQKNGSSAVLLDTPKLTGPFTLPAAASAPDSAAAQYDVNSTADLGPSAAEVAGNFIGGSPESGQIGTPSAVNTTFGVNGGVFGNGFAPGNYGTSGVPASFTPYYQPYYGGTNLKPGALNTASNAFIPSGSAPAFDPAGDGHGPTSANFKVNGLSLGLNAFAGVKPGAGTYTLGVSIQTIGSVLTQPPATATIANPAMVLPVATTGSAAPAVTFNGDGTATVTNVAINAPVVGAYVELIDYGATDSTTATSVAGCNGATLTAPVFYTQWVTASGPVTFANANAPEGQTTAVCTAAQNATALNTATNVDTFTGDRVQVVVIGFDYNEYGFQYNGKTGSTYPQSPALPAQADSSISTSTYAVSL